MSKDEIYEKLKEIIVEQLGINADEIKMDSTFADDLAADSLDIVELVMEIEEKFDISIPDDEAEKIITVSDIVNYISDNTQE